LKWTRRELNHLREGILAFDNRQYWHISLVISYDSLFVWSFIKIYNSFVYLLDCRYAITALSKAELNEILQIFFFFHSTSSSFFLQCWNSLLLNFFSFIISWTSHVTFHITTIWISHVEFRFRIIDFKLRTDHFPKHIYLAWLTITLFYSPGGHKVWNINKSS